MTVHGDYRMNVITVKRKLIKGAIPTKRKLIKGSILTILPYENLKGQQEASLECEKINSRREVSIYISSLAP